LRLPPMLAPIHVVIVPIYKGLEQLEEIENKMKPLMAELRSKGITVKFDGDDTKRSGWKFAEYELKGVPVRIAIGPKDIENGVVEIARRDTKEKSSVPAEGLPAYIKQLLDDIQQNLYNRALAYRNEHITEVNSWEEFKQVLNTKGGFVAAHWDGTGETEEKIKEETKATIRCIPLDNKQEDGVCVFSGKPSKQRVLFAMAY